MDVKNLMTAIYCGPDAYDYAVRPSTMTHCATLLNVESDRTFDPLDCGAHGRVKSKGSRSDMLGRDS